MKKDTTTIKRILRQTDNTNLHGYFKNEDDFVISNGYSVILSDVNSNGDFITDIENLNNAGHYDFKLFADYIKNNIEEQNKNGSETLEILVNDLKMWKKHAEKGKPFIIPTKKGLMGVNPSYLLDLATLTRQDKNNTLIKIKVIDKKAPLYIDGNGVKAVLCPVVVDSTEKTYDNFKNKLANCYDLEKTTKQAKQEQKAHINTDKIEKDVIYNGFTLYFASRQLFILSDKKRVTNDITNEFLKIMTNITGIDYINKITEYDYIYYKSCVQAATITKTTSYSGNEVIRIETKSNPETFYENEYDRLIIYNGNMEKVDICTDDMSATDPETTETKTADNMSANNTTTATTTDTTNKLIYDTYPIIHNNNVVEKGGYYINKGNYDYIIIQNDFSGVYILYNLNYMHICGTNKDYFETIQDTINYLNAMDQETYFNNLKHLSVEEIHSIYKKYTPCQYHVIRQYIDKWDVKADTIQDTTPTQDTPQKTSVPAVSLFVVTDKPQPVKLYGANIPTLERIPTYTQRIISRFKPLKMQGVYNNRVNNKKPLKKAYNDFVGTVSCYNDKCASGGGMVAVNTS